MHRDTRIDKARVQGTRFRTEETVGRVAKFYQEVKSTDFHPTDSKLSVRYSELTAKRTKRAPERAHDNVGLAWLKSFLDYDGDECLLFPFRTAACPRGTVTYNFKTMPAHRAMCLMRYKLPADPKAWALHKCGNGHLGCVNPNHLYWGDRSDNAKDAHRHLKEGKHPV